MNFIYAVLSGLQNKPKNVTKRPREDFRKVPSQDKAGCLYGKVNGSRLDPQLYGANKVCQVDRNLDAVPLCTCKGRALKRKNGSASTSVWEKAAHSALTLKLDNSVPSHILLALLELLPYH